MSEVEELADEFVGTWFAENPLWASLLGLPGDHDRLPDPRTEAAQRFRARYSDLAAAAESAQGDPVTRGVVVQQARAAVDVIDAAEPEFSVSDPLSAPGLMLLNLLPQVTLTDEERSEGHVARLAELPSYLDAVVERQRGAALPGFLVRAGADLLGRYLDHPESDPLSLPGHSFVDRQEALLADAVRPAFARYREFLVEDLLPRALPEDKAGLCWQPDGEQRYERLARVHTTTDRTPQDLHETGLRLADELAEEYRELGSRVFGTSDLPEIFERLRTDPALRWTSGEELLEAARTAIRKAEAVAPRWFRTVPEQQCEVRPVPPAEADSGTIAYYLQPDFAGTRKGTYFANTYRPQERFRHTSEAIASPFFARTQTRTPTAASVAPSR